MREFHALLRWTKVWMRSVWVKSGQFPTARRTHRRHHARGTALGTTHIKEEKKQKRCFESTIQARNDATANQKEDRVDWKPLYCRELVLSVYERLASNSADWVLICFRL